MTIAMAQQFIERVVNDKALADQINAAPDSEAIQTTLSDLGYCFNHEEFEKAYYNVLTNCQTYGQAEFIKGIKLWWDCLGYCFSQ
ncbi:MAG: Nif11-like leader peptide family RiPP precursor [Planctomycetota bacterium]|jgi:predicted ribosomally synthesized peptide with nif11-like leader